MRTRNSGTPKPAPPPKKTPPSRRSATRTPPNPPPETTVEQPVEHESPSADVVEVTPENKPTRGAKARASTRKAPVRTQTPAPTRASSRRTSKSGVIEQPKIEDSPDKDEAGDIKYGESAKKEETSEPIAEESMRVEHEKEEVGDHGDGESNKKEEIVEDIAEEPITRVEPEKEDVRDHGDTEPASKEGKSEAVAEESVMKVEPVIENFEVTKEEGKSEAIVEESVMKVEPVVENFEVTKEEGKSEAIAEDSIMIETVIENVEVTKEEGKAEAIVEESVVEVEPVIGDVSLIKGEETLEAIVEESRMEVEAVFENVEERTLEAIVDESMMKLDPVIENVEVTEREYQNVPNVEETPIVEEKSSDRDQPLVPDIGLSAGEERDIDPDRDSEEYTLDTEKEIKTIDLEENIKAIEPEREEKTVSTEQHLDQNVVDVEEPSEIDEETFEKEENLDQSVKANEYIIATEELLVTNEGEATSQEEPISTDVIGSSEFGTKEEEETKEEPDEEMRIMEDEVSPKDGPVNMEEDVAGEDVNVASKEKDAQAVKESSKKESLEESGNKGTLKELEETHDDMQEHGGAADALEDERAELTAAAKERKIRKEKEIFVGGIDRDVTEEDVKKAFENIGEIVEVRLLKESSSKKNRGYAFVKFATKEQAKQALSEMKNPLIRGKQCRTAPSEDDDMIFLGNICNTWTKEAIRQKLKDYGIEGVEHINVVPDVRREGLTRGFAFLEFSCHADAMKAYKRLQKPDVIFGHTERTAKVAFAEPVREADPQIMAQVKSIFVDGLPPQWNEDKVREKLKGYGEIVRVMLARNMAHAKRRDYGFVDFTTHEAAVACIEGINSKDIGEGNSKGKVRARLSNPLPKTQAVKGGMCGGFRIGRGVGTASSSRTGRGNGWGGHAVSRQNFQRDRGSYQRGHSQAGRSGFPREHDVHMQYPPFQRREMFGRGAWRAPFPVHDTFVGGPAPLRPHLDIIRHDVPDRGHGRHVPNTRLPFPSDERFNRPVMGRNTDEPYFYDGGAHGMKRPYFMTDPEPDYMEHSRLRPRMDYSDAAVPYRPPSYRDSIGASSNRHSHDYYGPDQGEVQPSAFHGIARPYGRGYYY